MVSDSLEFRSTSGARGQKQFLKHDRVHSEANTAIRFRGKQLCCGRVAPEVANDHVGVEKHEGTISTRTFLLFEPLGLGHLFHIFKLYAGADSCS